MGEDIFVVVRDLLSQNISIDQIKNRLVKQGFLEADVDDAIERAALQLRLKKIDSTKKMIGDFAWKEVLDRIGYGFVSHPFLNILFSFSGASYFLIGFINGLRTVLSLLYSSFLKEFSRVHEISKAFISRSGILYGFSFLILSFAVVVRSPLLYSLAFLAGSLGVVAHGEIYTKFLRDNLKKERMGAFLSRISSYGILITVVSLLISGYVMDLFPLAGKLVSLSLFGRTFSVNVYGYLISFEITAFAFILSGYVLSRIKQEMTSSQAKMSSFVKEFVTRIKVHSGFFVSNKIVVFLTLTSIITGLVQVLGNSFYGIRIYNEFKNQFIGGFLNVAVVFSIAVVFSFIGPWFTRRLRHHIGISPMLVFGTLLTAMLPLSLAYNPHLIVVSVATALSIVGSSILGMAQGFFTRKLLSEAERQIYFSFVGVAVSLPLLILSPIGAYLGQVYGLVFLFKMLIFLLVFVATPLYFLIVLLYERTLEKAF
ncbi:MAG: hypothetical protein ISS25_02145 [Nanoarchaeota archaeon]|nr:hypothetical protein [DPANN group archaeon]MBL7116607.1 hypothetical protein [Nanoarchaeota archaeon]